MLLGFWQREQRGYQTQAELQVNGGTSPAAAGCHAQRRNEDEDAGENAQPARQLRSVGQGVDVAVVGEEPREQAAQSLVAEERPPLGLPRQDFRQVSAVQARVEHGE